MLCLWLKFCLKFRFLFDYVPRELSPNGRADVFDHEPESFSEPWPVEDVHKGIDHVDEPVPRVGDHTYQLFVGSCIQGDQLLYVDWNDKYEVDKGENDGGLHDFFGSIFVVKV